MRKAKLEPDVNKGKSGIMKYIHVVDIDNKGERTGVYLYISMTVFHIHIELAGTTSKTHRLIYHSRAAAAYEWLVNHWSESDSDSRVIMCGGTAIGPKQVAVLLSSCDPHKNHITTNYLITTNLAIGLLNKSSICNTTYFL